MYIFILIWLLFIFVYMIFNAYGVYRILKMRIKGDKTPLAVGFYIFLIFIIIIISIILISQLDWSKSLSQLFKI